MVSPADMLLFARVVRDGGAFLAIAGKSGWDVDADSLVNELRNIVFTRNDTEQVIDAPVFYTEPAVTTDAATNAALVLAKHPGLSPYHLKTVLSLIADNVT